MCRKRTFLLNAIFLYRIAVWREPVQEVWLAFAGDRMEPIKSPGGQAACVMEDVGAGKKRRLFCAGSRVLWDG